jgi:hypothetical protein
MTQMTMDTFRNEFTVMPVYFKSCKLLSNMNQSFTVGKQQALHDRYLDNTSPTHLFGTESRIEDLQDYLVYNAGVLVARPFQVGDMRDWSQEIVRFLLSQQVQRHSRNFSTH